MDVLLVEDERLILMMLSRMVSGMGHRVAASLTSAEAAIEYLEGHAVDFILMDIELDGRMDGVEACAIIRERWNIPFAFASAYTDTATRDRAESTGPVAFLPKPIKPSDLEDAMARIPA